MDHDSSTRFTISSDHELITVPSLSWEREGFHSRNKRLNKLLVAAIQCYTTWIHTESTEETPQDREGRNTSTHPNGGTAPHPSQRAAAWKQPLDDYGCQVLNLRVRLIQTQLLELTHSTKYIQGPSNGCPMEAYR